MHNHNVFPKKNLEASILVIHFSSGFLYWNQYNLSAI
jgi:hypothetical protein